MSTLTSYFTGINLSLNRYGPIPLLLFGRIGNLFNLLIFTRKAFRNNICVIYFLASTIFDTFMIAAGLLSRVLNGFGYDVAQNSSILCKLRILQHIIQVIHGWIALVLYRCLANTKMLISQLLLNQF
jgi:hypothetical protein